jgi:8-amino-7-oxononanoate synthase
MAKGLKEFLFNFSSPVIYSTTLPEAHAASAQDVLEAISGCEEERRRLHGVSRLMKQVLEAEGFRVKGDAHILAVEIGKEEKATAVAAGLLDKGILAFAARYPTVAPQKAILRIGMTAEHREADVGRFVESLSHVCNDIEQKGL